MPQPLTSRTRLLPVPLVPEISVHRVDDTVGLFDLTGNELRDDRLPPFWAFVWAGGQALARYVLDHPEVVAGRRVLDVAAGGGVAAIGAALAGAASVEAVDLDPAAGQALLRNAAANGVTVTAHAADVVDRPAVGAEVLLAGDVFYSPTTAARMSQFLRAARRAGATVLVGDPGRGFFPERLFTKRAEYVVPVAAALEETEALSTAVWEMRATYRAG
ncbi:MAG TPA: 50S ribosomal protein L11 methyltransferase [Actinoplanes sp.]|nr:50S ribosomal protein L11 methyltransferase [Actinoplanes sp.]